MHHQTSPSTREDRFIPEEERNLARETGVTGCDGIQIDDSKC